VFCRSLFVLMTMVLSVLFQFTVSDYAFGILKLFLDLQLITHSKMLVQRTCFKWTASKVVINVWRLLFFIYYDNQPLFNYVLQDTTLTMSLLVSIYGSGALNIKNIWSHWVDHIMKKHSRLVLTGAALLRHSGETAASSKGFLVSEGDLQVRIKFRSFTLLLYYFNLINTRKF
jgi:hypothetical protein